MHISIKLITHALGMLHPLVAGLGGPAGQRSQSPPPIDPHRHNWIDRSCCCAPIICFLVSVASCAAPGDRCVQSSARRRCTWTVWRPCAFGNVALARPTWRTATRIRATGMCTASHLRNTNKRTEMNNGLVSVMFGVTCGCCVCAREPQEFAKWLMVMTCGNLVLILCSLPPTNSPQFKGGLLYIFMTIANRSMVWPIV